MNIFKFTKYIRRVFYKRGMPLNLIYFVTSKCNARCRHCFYWKKINTVEDELGLDQIEKVAKSIPGLLTLSLTGGEPFLRNELVEIALLFSKFTGVSNIQIPTNGILTDSIVKKTREILMRCRKDVRIVVGVSMDNFAEKHDATRQVEGCFEKAVKTIRQLKSLENQFSNFQVGSIITITKENQERAIDLVNFLENELNLEEIGINIIRSGVRDMSLKDLDIKYYEETMFKLRKDFFQRFGQIKKPSWVERVLSARQYYGSKLLSRIYLENKYITPCYAGSLLAIMKEDGDVYPCEMVNKKMGNLADYNFNFKKLWFSRRAKEVRREIKKEKCFCTYECAMTSNTLFNPRHLLPILKDSLKKKANPRLPRLSRQ